MYLGEKLAVEIDNTMIVFSTSWEWREEKKEVKEQQIPNSAEITDNLEKFWR